jgi:phosphoribosylformylglycinamidine cyclo-ligase
MGVGMIMIVSPDDAELALRLLADAGERAFVMGEVVVGEGVGLC